MELITLAVSLLAVLAAYRLVSDLKKRRRLPPGPPSLPLFGSSFWLSFPIRIWMLKTPGLYGQVCSFELDGQVFVVLNNFDAIQEAFQTHAGECSGRPKNLLTDHVMENCGLLTADGPRYKKLRRFSLQALRDSGFGKSRSEEAIVKEALDLMAALAETKGQPVCTATPFNKAVSNVICCLVFGRRIADEDPDFETKLALINQITQSAAPSRSIFNILLLTALRLVSPKYLLKFPFAKKMVRLFDSVYSFCQTQMDHKNAAYNPDEEPHDFIEAFLAERQRLKDAVPEDKAHLSDKNLQVSISDLFLAGTDTTANSLRWIALHLSLHQDLQDRLSRYVRDRLGDRTPGMADRSTLPLVEAFLHEAQRFYTLVPSTPHRTTTDTELQGYLIPKDSVVVANLQAVHLDPANFSDPETFNPDRFLDANSGCFRPSDRVIPFAIGKRTCLGESLARMELFLFTVLLLQNFRVSIPDREAARLDEIKEYTGGVVHSPGQHLLIFERRDD